MDTTLIALATLIATIATLIIALVSNMFPQFFPSIGAFLLEMKLLAWLVLIFGTASIGQLIFIITEL